MKANWALIDLLNKIGEEKGATPAQLALAWLLHRGEHIVSIPGTTKKTRFDENQAANDVVLTAEELTFLDENLPVGAAAGERY